MTETQSLILFKQRQWRLKANKETVKKYEFPLLCRVVTKHFKINRIVRIWQPPKLFGRYGIAKCCHFA